MEYVSESYGGVKKSKPKQQPKDELNESITTKESSAHSRDSAKPLTRDSLHEPEGPEDAV
jgi:hypothetical protein